MRYVNAPKLLLQAYAPMHGVAHRGFAHLARTNPSWRVIDSTQPEADVHRQVVEVIRSLLEKS